PTKLLMRAEAPSRAATTWACSSDNASGSGCRASGSGGVVRSILTRLLSGAAPPRGPAIAPAESARPRHGSPSGPAALQTRPCPATGGESASSTPSGAHESGPDRVGRGRVNGAVANRGWPASGPGGRHGTPGPDRAPLEKRDGAQQPESEQVGLEPGIDHQQ